MFLHLRSVRLLLTALVLVLLASSTAIVEVAQVCGSGDGSTCLANDAALMAGTAPDDFRFPTPNKQMKDANEDAWFSWLSISWPWSSAKEKIFNAVLWRQPLVLLQLAKTWAGNGVIDGYQDGFGWTALLAAAKTGQVEAVRVLIAAGANVHVEDRFGTSALHLAVYFGHEEICRLLIAQGVNVNAVSKHYGHSPLEMARSIFLRDSRRRRRGKAACGTMLEKAGAVLPPAVAEAYAFVEQIRARGVSYRFAVSTREKKSREGGGGQAADHDQDKEKDAAAVAEARENIWEAAKINQLEVLLPLAQQWAGDARVINWHNMDFWHATPLHAACTWGHEASVLVLLAAGADVNAIKHDGWSPLIHAAGNGYDNIVRVLLDAGADIYLADDQGRLPINKAIDFNRPEVVSVLQSAIEANKARVSSYIKQHMSSSGFRFTVALNTLNNNNNNSSSSGNSTAAAAAATAAIDASLSRKSKSTTKTTTAAAAAKALFEAAKANNIGALFDLASMHAGNALVIDGYRDWNGKTALLVAINNGYEEAVRVLVAAGASLFATNNGGWTALHHAVFVGHAALCEILVDEGAPVNVVADSYTPLRMARHEHISSATFGGSAVAAASPADDASTGAAAGGGGGGDASDGSDEVWRRKGDFVSKGREACATKIEAAGGRR